MLFARSSDFFQIPVNRLHAQTIASISIHQQHRGTVHKADEFKLGICINHTLNLLEIYFNYEKTKTKRNNNEFNASTYIIYVY